MLKNVRQDNAIMAGIDVIHARHITDPAAFTNAPLQFSIRPADVENVTGQQYNEVGKVIQARIRIWLVVCGVSRQVVVIEPRPAQFWVGQIEIVKSA
jgi:hypothetical protein